MSDTIVVVLYFLATMWIGFRSKSQETKDSYFLGKHNLSWVLLLASLVATETSSLTFLSVPALSYKGDFSFITLAIGYLLGRIAVAFFLLPDYFAHGTLSIYSYIGSRSSVLAQRLLSLIFTISRLLGDGIRLYVTSIPLVFLAAKLGFQLESQLLNGIAILFLLTIVTTAYSVYGGFRAIVWTDTLQLCIYLLGGFFALFLLLNLPLSAIDPMKWNVFHLDWSAKDPYFLPFALMGGFFLSLGSHGTDLMLVQRVLAAKDLNQARKVLIGSGILVIFQFALFLTIGVFLFSFFQGKNVAGDEAFSKFLVEELPSPILGLVLSGILASAMSTLSSTINSLSLTWSLDWKTSFSPKILSWGFGFLLFLSSLFPFFLQKEWQAGLLETGLTVFSYTLGPSLGVFLFAKFRLRYSNLVLVFLLSLLTNLYMAKTLVLPFTVLVPLGLIWFFVYFFVFKLLASIRLGLAKRLE